MNESLSFYDALAPMFDVMTDWEARLALEGPFLRAQLEAAAARRVLDAACGSGGHALWLARLGYEVAGADSSGVMIALAQEKAAAAGLEVSFFVADLSSLLPVAPATPEDRSSVVSRQLPVVSRQSSVGGRRSAVGGGLLTAAVTPESRAPSPALPLSASPPLPFDTVLCLGNSLPHLLSQEDLVAALRRMAEALRPDGLLLLQNLNYDLRWRTQPRWFAAQGGELDGQPVLVWRFADYDEPAGRIAFHIALFRQEGGQWQVQVHTTPQRPLFHADLLAALSDAGFSDVRAYGKMALPPEPFDARGSGDLVIVAHKRGV